MDVIISGGSAKAKIHTRIGNRVAAAAMTEVVSKAEFLKAQAKVLDPR